MTASIRRWSGGDILKLEMLAQKYPTAIIAQQLGKEPRSARCKGT
jgi:hypothetical protein